MQHKIVSREEWLEAREALLAKEKEWTRLRDQLSAERRELPWVKIDKEYAFEGPNGKETLGGLFAGRSQLVIKHFMLGPGWKDRCVGCSFESDHIDGASRASRHFVRRSVTGPLSRDRRDTEADGLAIPVAVIVWQRLQL